MTSSREQKRKKVLFLVPSFGRGGMENMLVSVSNLVAAYADVTIYNLGGHDEKMRSRLSDKIQYYAEWSPCKNLFHCGLKNFLTGNFRLLPGQVWYRFHRPSYLHKKIIREHFDTEIAFFVGEPAKIVAGCSDSNVNKILWIHNDYKICSGLLDFFRNLDDAVRGFRAYTHIVCVSKAARASFEEITGIHSAEVIYNYLPVRRICEDSKQPVGLLRDRFSVVAVGRLVSAKGFDRLLQVAVRLNQLSFDYQIWIVGDGAERENLELYARENYLTNVRFFGMQENPYPYIANADLLICSSRYEGYNLTVAEAMILGVPVLSTRCTGPSEILDNGKYGMLVENNEDGLYNGMKAFLENPELIRVYKNKALERADFFDENKLSTKIKEIL